MPSVLQPLARVFLTHWVKPETYVVLGPQRLFEVIGDRKKSTSEINAESSRYELVTQRDQARNDGRGQGRRRPSPSVLGLAPGRPLRVGEHSEAAHAVV